MTITRASSDIPCALNVIDTRPGRTDTPEKNCMTIEVIRYESRNLAADPEYA